jgi:hypothetical protein
MAHPKATQECPSLPLMPRETGHSFTRYSSVRTIGGGYVDWVVHSETGGGMPHFCRKEAWVTASAARRKSGCLSFLALRPRPNESFSVAEKK